MFESLPENIRKKSDSLEKLYIAIGIMENQCHTYMHKRLSDKQRRVMRLNVIKTLNISIDGVNAKVNGEKAEAVVKLGRDIDDSEIKKAVTDLGYKVTSISIS